MKIDSHQHFWRYNTDEYGWIDENMSVIRRDFLPEDLKAELRYIGFEGSIAVQARQSMEETDWLLGLAKKFEFIKGVVGWIDLCSSNVENLLTEFASHPKAVGVRHVIHDEPDLEFMLRPDFVRGVGLLEQFNLTYDLLIFPKHLPTTVEFVSKFSDKQRFVIDHIAKPSIFKGEIEAWALQIAQLAKFPNVYCKLSGMVTEADWKHWKEENIFPFLDVIFEAFGVNRLMIGSDWPVCKVAGEYEKVMSIVLNYIQKFPKATQDKITGLNAIKFYNLNS